MAPAACATNEVGLGAIALGVLATPVCTIRGLASPPPHCPRKAHKRPAAAVGEMHVHGVATLTFEGRLALAADPHRRSRLLQRHRVAA